MRLVTHIIEHASRSDTWFIKPLGDIHLGSINCDEALLDKDIQWTLENEARWVGLGDYMECITSKDRRWRPEDIAPWCRGEKDIAEAQLQRLVKKLDPIKHLCLGLLKGNHEDKIYDLFDNNVYARLLHYLGVEDKRIRLDMRGFIRLLFRRKTSGPRNSGRQFVIYCEHGYGGGRLDGAAALALGRLAKNFHAQLFLMGHRHRELSMVDERISVRGNKLVGEKLGLVVCGTYLKSWEEGTEIYVERHSYPPKPTGTPLIQITPWSNEIKITI